MKHRQYHFVSPWSVDADVKTTEHAILDIEHWKEWWPGLLDAQVVTHNGDIVGSTIFCTFRSLAGYKLSMHLTCTYYEPQRLLVFTSTGDLEGVGGWTFAPTDSDGTRMKVTWDVATTKHWMNAYGLLLQPLFEINHFMVMRRGERGLRAYLKPAE